MSQARAYESTNVGDLIDQGLANLRTGPFGTQLKASDYGEEGVPVLNVRNLGSGSLRPADIERAPWQVQERLSCHLLRAGDIVFGRKGAVDRHVLISDDQDGWMQGSDCIRLRLESDAPVLAEYLSKMLLTDSHKMWMEAQCSHGATMASLNQDTIRRIVLHLPPMRQQRRVVAVLTSFDELIEINERRIELLENLARSLYREWFVHFRFPGHEAIEFVDSELGKIPEGWCVRRIDDVTSSVTRGIAPKYADDGHWTVLNQRCIRNQRVTFTLTRRHEGSVSDAKQLRFGDVLINSTGVGTLGRVGMLLEETGRATVDSHVTIVRPASPDLHPWFGLHLLSRESAFRAMGTGSTGQTELGRAAVGELPLLVPPMAVLEAFGDVAWPLLRPMSTLLWCCDSLAGVRDLLLPRLVSGQLDISDIDLGALTPAEAE